MRPSSDSLSGGRLVSAAQLLACIALLLALLFGFGRGSFADTGSGDLPVGRDGQAMSPAKPTDLDRRLAAQGLSRGSPVLIRIFKEESELELWMLAGDRYRKFATYPICRWRGVLGPKLSEGDRQSPEGFYSFGQDQLFWQGHWFRAFNINYPNTLDRALGRTGSGILIHGACSSIGCYAMTDPQIDEIFDLVVAAFAGGQTRVQVHLFPFHMTLANLARHERNPWASFWRDLKPASDLFVSTQLPPRIGVCDGRYVVRAGQASVPPDPRIRDWCGAVPWTDSADRLVSTLESRRATAMPPASAFAAAAPSDRVLIYARLLREGKIPKPKPLPAQPASFGPSPDSAAVAASIGGDLAALPEREREALLGTRNVPVAAAPAVASVAPAGGPAAASPPPCNTGLASCRHFLGGHSLAVRQGKTKLAKR